MDKNYLIKLTNSLYKLTLLFPKKEPLRYKMRELADNVLQKILVPDTNIPVSGTINSSVIENIEILDSFFEVAKAQNWVAPLELLRLQEEYNKIKAEIKKTIKRPPEQETADIQNLQEQITEVHPPTLLQVGNSAPTTGGGNSRQKRILEFLKENGRAQVWQMQRILPEVTKRTLRRDFESLVKQGIVERIGERNATFYQLKR